jgi:hypothetical protein
MKKSILISIVVVVILVLIIGGYMILKKPKDLSSQQNTNNQPNSNAPIAVSDEAELSTATNSIDTTEFSDTALNDLG